MRWEGNRESSNVEDMRGAAPTGLMVGGLGTLVIVLLGMFFGINPATLMRLVQSVPGRQAPAEPGAPVEETPEEARAAKFVRVVLADTEDVWTRLLPEMGRTYVVPTLRMYRGATDTACGMGQSAMGPFYCPADQKVYIDLGFFDELEQKFRAPGDFARAYVIAHEVGHHVQNLLGLSDQVQAARRRQSEAEANEMSVRLELQADFFAGVWAHHANEARGILESGDVEAALRAATAIGDDTLQRKTQGRIVPDSFTHGTSEQRVRWFTKGLRSGDPKQGDTFSVPARSL